MGEMQLYRPALIGRDEELGRLKQALDGAMGGHGSTIFISGEPGIGKTRLVEAFQDLVSTQDVKILTGAASADTAQPDRHSARIGSPKNIVFSWSPH